MKYLIGIPVCILFVSAFSWWQSNGSTAAPSPVSESGSASRDGSAPFADGAAKASITFTRSITENATNAQMDPIVIAPCTLVPAREQTVSSQLDGVLKKINVRLGQTLTSGDCLGILDSRKLRIQIEVLQIKAKSESAERIAKAMYDEANAKVVYAETANKRSKGYKAVPELEYKTYLAQRERFLREMDKAREERQAAKKELEKAELLLKMHQIDCSLDGEVTKIYRKEGETIKQAEPLFQIVDTDRLYVDGFCKVQHAHQLRRGMQAHVEPDLQGAQILRLVGHTAAVNALATSPDGKLVASASDDRTVLIWNWPSGRQHATLSHPAPVLSVDIAEIDAGRDRVEYVFVTGCQDGIARVWSIIEDGSAGGPTAEWTGHEGPIRSVCISPDGRHCVTGGDDRRIGWWDLKTNKRIAWVVSTVAFDAAAHQGAVTSVDFIENDVVVSMGRDNVQKVWKLNGARTSLTKLHRGRTGDVYRSIGDRKTGRLLFDHGSEIRILDRHSGTVVSRIESWTNIRFRAFARFSPSGAFILAASPDGRVQLWRTPDPSQPTAGGFVIRQYHLPKASEVQCSVFARDEKVFFTGGTDHVVRVWAVPNAASRRPRKADLTYVGSEMEQGTDLVRIRAEMDNSQIGGLRLRPGTFVTLKIQPQLLGR